MKRADQWETSLAFLGLIACYLLGWATHWMGAPKAFDSTAYWPFFVDTWFERTVFTGRVVLPLLALVLVLPFVRRWLDDEGPALPMLCALIVCAWSLHLSVNFVRNGVEAGLKHTFDRQLEYWWDVRWVGAGFLAKFPEIGVRLSQHGATHPPGAILFLSLVKWIGFETATDAEFVCTPIAALTALPLWGAARRLTDDKSARMAVPLYLFACSINLFSVLCMDVLTMLLATTALYGFARALDGEKWGGGILGLSLGAATMCSFIALMMPLGFAVLAWSRREKMSREVIRAGAISVGVFVGFYLILWIGFGYRVFHVMVSTMQALAADGAELRLRGRSMLRAPLAYWGSLGVGLSGLVVHATGTTLRRLRQRTLDEPAWLMLASIVPWLVPVLLGKPRAEVEHVFLLFVPFTAMAATFAARRWYERDPDWVTRIAVPLAVVQAIAVEVFYETYW